MKNLRKSVACILVVGVSFLFMPMMLALASGTATLRFSSTSPPVSFSAETERWLGREIEKRTGGSIKMESYFAGSLLQIRENLEGIKRGIADIALIPPLWFAGQLPLMSYTQVAELGPSVESLKDPKVVGKALWKIWDEFPAMRKELEEWNQTAFAFRPMPGYHIWSKVPIRSLNDLKGLRIRHLGIKGRIILAPYGAIPTSVTPAELYGALQKGTVDAAVASPDWGETFRLKEVTKYLIMVYANAGCNLFTINMDTLNKLQPHERDVLLKLGRDYTIEYANAFLKLETELFKKYEEAGVTIIEFPKEEREKWRKSAEPKLIETWLKEAKVPTSDGRRIVERFLTYMGGADVIPWLRK